MPKMFVINIIENTSIKNLRAVYNETSNSFEFTNHFRNKTFLHYLNVNLNKLPKWPSNKTQTFY